MLKVWGRSSSINVQKVMWLVGELGLDHERFDVGAVPLAAPTHPSIST